MSETVPRIRRVFNVAATVYVTVEVNDPQVIDRVLTNEDGWREQFYDFTDTDAVIDHLAYNAAINNAQINQLDGWADLPAGAASAHVTGWDLGEVTERPTPPPHIIEEHPGGEK